MTKPEIWAGPECSVVRVGDAYVDQTKLTRHEERPEDLDRLAALGVRAVRYPVLWERTWPDFDLAPDFAFADERLARMRERGMRPIVGLVHHGSGPKTTSLLDDGFVDGLARFARAVAERFSWVTDYTPVNEPLTTARFSALYGHWYPHAQSDAAFVRALLVECFATRAAMRAIREVVPGARLVQTEDMGTVSSTPTLAYQARFENDRRFLSLDLLTGRVDAAHPLHAWLVAHGAPPEDLADLQRDPCPPDVVGINHYATSDRFLDERVAGYPPHVVGGNGRHVYADVEAARVLAAGIDGHGPLLETVWERYRLPVALTEVHLGCTPEEQMRWLHDAWQGALRAQEHGVDVRALTVWSVFGACDWDSLLTNPRGHYEPGLFDVRGGVVRPTGLARLTRQLATEGRSDEPLLAEPGWWAKPSRIVYASYGRSACAKTHPEARRARPILVTGAAGTLGRAIARVAEGRGLRVVTVSRAELDVTDEGACRAAVDAHDAWAVVNAAGYVRVDDAEREVEACMRINADGATALAEACAARGVRYVTFSSDLVFDGSKAAAYVESDEPSPLNVYGRSKAEAERRVLERLPDALVVRTSAFFGPWDDANFVRWVIRELAAGRSVTVASDEIVSPTYVPDLAEATLTLLVDGGSGIHHVSSPSALTWLELARETARRAGLPELRVVGRPGASLGRPARRPPFSALASERSSLMRPVADGLARFFDELPAFLAAG